MDKQRLKLIIEINEEEDRDFEYEIEELNQNLNDLTIPELKKVIAKFLCVKKSSINITGNYK